MLKYQVLLQREDEDSSRRTVLHTPSLPMALVVADINLDAGTAEIWSRDQRVARLRKRRGREQAYWEVF
jgi:hypothetical protein